MSSAERRALIMLFSLGVLGQGVRWFATRPGQAPGSVEILAALPPASPLAHRDSALALARPLGANEKIDVDRASAAELARLPRVGIALAKTILADREAKGPFGSLEGLDRVPGIGPALLDRLAPHVAFSGSARSPPVTSGILPNGEDTGRRSGSRTLAVGPLPAGVSRSEPLDLNRATVKELDALPGIGPTRAEAIVRFRDQHGAFGTIDALAAVPGLGPAALARLRELVQVR